MNQVMTTKQKQLFEMTTRQCDSSCWIWHGQISNSGYGRIKQMLDDHTVQMVSAQSASYREFNGPVPEGCLVRQRCGNRLCINPEHLELLQMK